MNQRTYSLELFADNKKDLEILQEVVKKTLSMGSTTQINLNADELVLYPGQAFVLTPSQVKNEWDSYSFKSANPGVATISQGGKVTAVKKGSTTITIQASSKLKTTVKVTVKSTPAIQLPAQSMDMEVGDELQLAPTVKLDKKATVTVVSCTYTSDRPDVVTISDKGEMLAVGAGTAVIEVHSSLGKSASLKVKVNGQEPTNDPPQLDASQVHYRALLIGNSDYPGTEDDRIHSKYAVNGMRSMLATLGQTYTTTVRENRSASQIKSDIQAAFSGVSGNDISLFFYAGHGTRDGELVGVDENGVSTRDLYQALEKIPGRVIVILDCCYSGKAIAGSTTDNFGNAVIRQFNHDTIPDVWRETGTGQTAASAGELRTSKYLVLTAASAYESAWGLTELDTKASYLLFTRALTQGAGWDSVNNRKCTAEADQNRDKRITMQEMYQYTYATVMRVARENGETQHVQVWPTNSSELLFKLK